MDVAQNVWVCHPLSSHGLSSHYPQNPIFYHPLSCCIKPCVIMFYHGYLVPLILPFQECLSDTHNLPVVPKTNMAYLTCPTATALIH